jgi:hypothetical protein
MSTGLPCSACSLRTATTHVRDRSGDVDTTLGLVAVGTATDQFVCPTCGLRYRLRHEPWSWFHDYDDYWYDKLDADGVPLPGPTTRAPSPSPEPSPPTTREVTIIRCPVCGSTDALCDESRSAVDLSYMCCRACGEGKLCDSWERNDDWYLTITLPIGVTTLPTHVAPLPPGAGFYESLAAATAPAAQTPAPKPTPAPTPTPKKAPPPPPPPLAAKHASGVGCARCRGDDAGLAWLAIQSLVRPLVSDAHLEIVVNKCASCGQRFIVVFTERVSFDGDSDDLTWLAVPVDEAGFRALGTARRAEVQHLVEQLGEGERFLVRHQAGSQARTWWVDGGFAIGPHS